MNEARQERKLKLHFRRFEFKYLIPPRLHQKIKDQLGTYMSLDPYAERNGYYLVTSLYYDSPGLRYYYENEAGLKNRRKIRHRFYNDDSSKLFWEIKRKKGVVVLKDRCLAAASNNKVRDQLMFYTHLDRLRPAVWVSYRREPWVVSGSKLRVTFDNDLTVAKASRESQSMPGWQERLLPNLVVMELKYSGRLPNWLYRTLSQYCLQRQAVGKYRLAVERLRMV